MAKKTEITDWHVSVRGVSQWWAVSEEQRLKFLKSTCEDIAKAVKRHVDDVETAEVVPTIEHTCSHCGRPWTEDSREYNGGCCDEDEEHNPSATALDALIGGNPLEAFPSIRPVNQQPEPEHK
jgi:hypothetical protein